MKRISGLIICLFLLTVTVSAQNSKWQNALNEAKTEAQAKNKMILVYLTNEDSKSEEQQLERQLFDSPTFKGISSNYVLLRLKASKARRNSSKTDIYETRLKKIYNHHNTFPMIVLADALGNRTGISLSDVSDSAITEFLTKLQSY